MTKKICSNCTTRGCQGCTPPPPPPDQVHGAGSAHWRNYSVPGAKKPVGG